MSPESLFKVGADQIRVRLALEDWTELPATNTKEWKRLLELLRPVCHLVQMRLEAADHDGVDLYLLLTLRATASSEVLAGLIMRQLQDPSWQPFFDSQRFAWLGGHHVVTVRPEDTLASRPLERPGRERKRKYLERDLGRMLEHPWHPALTPEAAGLRFEAGLWFGYPQPECKVYLFYRLPETAREEAWAAAHLNTRLRVPGTRRLFESVGWAWGVSGGSNLEGEPAQLVFNVPGELLAEAPSTLEVWWSAAERKQVAVVPCYVEGTEPPEFIPAWKRPRSAS